MQRQDRQNRDRRAFPGAGRLTERIDIQHKQDGEWVNLRGKVWAELIPLTGKEFQAAESTRPAASVRWRVRYNARIAALDTRTAQIVHKSGTYNVTYIEDVRNAHMELYIVTEREDP